MMIPVTGRYPTRPSARTPISAIHTSTVRRAAYGLPGPCGDEARVVKFVSGHVGIVVVDIAGHGGARATFSSAVADEMLAGLVKKRSPAVALGYGDRALRMLDIEVPYAVAFAALINPAHRTLVYASAGHDLAFTIDGRGRVCDLRPTAAMLGIPMTINPCDALAQLHPDSALVIATDGIADSRPAGSTEFFGVERAAAAVRQSFATGYDPAFAVYDAALAHAGGRQRDDATVVVVHARAALADEAWRPKLKHLA